MELTVQGILGLLALACTLPLVVLTAEALAALCARSRTVSKGQASNLRVAVVVPAHNEEHGLPATLADLVSGLLPGDRCIVVADNCVDGTAQVARAFPVTVLERNDASRCGKGFALEHGIAHLRSTPPDVLVIIDADCRVQPNSLHLLANAAHAAARPVQGGNVLYPPPSSSVGSRVSAFAFLFKNHIRPLGMAQVGGPCLLFGTGMAFPWSVVESVAWGTAESVEDMQLAVKLALDGKSARYEPIPCVSGTLPSGSSAATSQRRRWEQGHIRTLLKYSPQLLWKGIQQRRLDLLLLSADLAVPPLSLLAALAAAALLLELAGWWFTGVWFWCALLTTAISAALVSILLAWSRFGRAMLSWQDLLLIPVYVAGKLPIYLGLFWRPQKAWRQQQPSTTLTQAKEREI